MMDTPHPYDYFRQPEHAQIARRVNRKLSRSGTPQGLLALHGVAHRLLAPSLSGLDYRPQFLVVRSNYEEVGNPASFVFYALAALVRRQSNNSHYLTLLAEEHRPSFDTTGIIGETYAAVAGSLDDPRHPAEYAPVAVIAANLGHCQVPLLWTARRTQ